MSEKFRLDRKISFQNTFYTKSINVIINSIGPSIILRSIFVKFCISELNCLLIACGALAASISVGIVIPSTWFVYLYKQTVSITVVVMGTKQFNDKTTHRQQVKTGFVQKWENRNPGLLQDYSRILPFFKYSISSQFCITQRFKVHFFQSEASK